MAVTHLLAGVPVSDMSVAIEFYARFFGRPPDQRPHRHEALWRLADCGLLYVVEDRRRAGHALATVMVDDLTRALDGLRLRGVDAGRVETVPTTGAQRATVVDPDGNLVTLAQIPPRRDD